MARRGWSTGEKQWTPEIVYKPAFSGPEEARRYQEAVASTPRLPGEAADVWADRIVAAARAVVMPEQRLPYREPGEDD